MKHAQKEADKCKSEMESPERDLRHLEDDLRRAEKEEETKK